jgi:hypothetical protein
VPPVEFTRAWRFTVIYIAVMVTLIFASIVYALVFATAT